jgi:hypothetical protein
MKTVAQRQLEKAIKLLKKTSKDLHACGTQLEDSCTTEGIMAGITIDSANISVIQHLDRLQNALGACESLRQ